MNTHTTWQQIAERLAEAGWSWQHQKGVDRAGGNLHVAKARNEEGERHVVVADAIAPAFVALEESIRAARQEK